MKKEVEDLQNRFSSYFDAQIEDSFDKYMKKYHFYESCDIDYDEICKEPKCHYARINIKNGEKIWFTCGRRKENMWPV